MANATVRQTFVLLFSATEAGAQTRLVRGDLIQCVSLHSKFLLYVGGGGGGGVDGNININN